MAQLEAGDITQAVIDRMADCTDERFKTVMTAQLVTQFQYPVTFTQ